MKIPLRWSPFRGNFITKPYNDMEHFALITSHDSALNDQRFKKKSCIITTHANVIWPFSAQNELILNF